ncbi:MAG: ATP-binding cassette domain-containing protein [Rhizobiaceae bacterium]|nr:ATP-binding cassette domain-containing protein [Rhizobiaceae bacterium]
MALLEVNDLKTHYRTPSGVLRAVDGVSLSVESGETVGLVGESGCGKSTLGRSVLRLTPHTAGRIRFDGADISEFGDRQMKPVRRKMQMVFQDPFASLNPRHTIGRILTDPLKVHGFGDRGERVRRAREVLDAVGLPKGAYDRWPHEFSGGQRQRIGIARAIILSPQLIVCDEPVSALDLSIQAQILNLLTRMKRELSLSYVFISHDLSVVRYIADRVLVMYLGEIIESGPSAAVWDNPSHPYTQALMQALPDPARRKPRTADLGDLPSARNIPAGCRFHPRCAHATDLCRKEPPPAKVVADGHLAACHYADTDGLRQ